MSTNAIHARLARIARDELKQQYASVEDQADAMAAAVMTELGLHQFFGVAEADGYQHEETFLNPTEAAEVVVDHVHDGRAGSYVITAWATGWERAE